MRLIAAPLLLALLIAAAGSAAADEAATLVATTYDDGVSCPGNCDAHVVLNKQHNGTRNAFRPAAGADPLANRASAARFPCVSGEQCVVCFAEASDTCMVTMYRGEGPPAGRVDATPAFMKERCDKPGTPAAIATECARLARDAATLAARVNCFAEPTHQLCRVKMEAAAAAKAADRPELEKCRSLGVRRYNAQQPDASLHRSVHNDCPYYENQRLTNSHGDSFQKLAPGACRDGFFVGPSGTDCCSGEPLQAAVDIGECRSFYPRR
ncbi:MAG TPA: hypothetical protein VE907_17255 [Gammaproteobacteria bacterium]|nr:hypothetical protein [Gammaproteobacteria bacterium]